MAEMSHRLTKSHEHVFVHESKNSQRNWGSPMRKAGTPINVQFEKDELHEINEVALHVTL